MPAPGGLGIPIPVPNPLDLLSGGAVNLAGGLVGQLGKAIYSGIVSAVSGVFDALAKQINNSAGSISFAPSSWWGTKVGLSATGTGLWATVVGLALAVMVGCVVLAAIQGAIVGEPMLAIRAVAVQVPTSMFGMVTVVAFTTLLVGAVDSASTSVLPGLDPNFKAWFASSGAPAFMPGFVMILVLVGALLVWLELVLRAGFVFLLVALAPLVLALRVWPAMAGLWRRFVEIGVALIVSKFVIAVALALGSAALAGGATDPASSKGITAMATGAGLMLVSAFAPFVLLRLIHGIEGALAGQGVSHAPGRAAITAVSVATSAAFIARLAAGSGGGRSIPAATAGGSAGGDNSPRPAPSTSLASAAVVDARSWPGSNPPAVLTGGRPALPAGDRARPGEADSNGSGS